LPLCRTRPRIRLGKTRIVDVDMAVRRVGRSLDLSGLGAGGGNRLLGVAWSGIERPRCRKCGCTCSGEKSPATNRSTIHDFLPPLSTLIPRANRPRSPPRAPLTVSTVAPATINLPDLN
jgi:hypothetical protein